MASEEKNESIEPNADAILKDEVKRYLDITWTDEETEKNVDDYIRSAKQYLNETTGTNINYEEDIKARDLLKDHCRYQRNKCIEFFGTNFLSDLTTLRFKYAIKDSKETEEE